LGVTAPSFVALLHQALRSWVIPRTNGAPAIRQRDRFSREGIASQRLEVLLQSPIA
jgi:hypothetical protein